MSISREEAHRIGYELFLSSAIHELNFREEVRLNDAKTKIGRLSEKTGISKEKLTEFAKFFVQDLKNHVDDKMLNLVDLVEKI
jgi:hypothetical protein